MESLTEIWKPVKGLEGKYEVSDQGQVRSLDRTVFGKDGWSQWRAGRVLSLGVSKNGYHVVVLAGKSRNVHRLVLEAFVGPCPARHEGCHENGIKTDNRLANLRWDNRPANNADRVRHGTSNRGERCGTAKLAERQAREILSSSESTRSLVEKYGITANQIRRIRSGERWGHLKTAEAVK